MFNPKSHGAFYALGGLSGLEMGLRTDRKAGLSVDETHLTGQVSFADAATYGTSMYGALGEKAPHPKPKRRLPPVASKSNQTSLGFIDRIRVFKTNRLPKKGVKPLHKLAWDIYSSSMGLVFLTLVAIISFSWGMSQDKAKGSWAEGVAMLVCLALTISAETRNQCKCQVFA
jgi:Ca2+-transporting ATPase